MRALITGIAGQDGSYLAELLLSKGYEVHGLIRRHSNEGAALANIAHIRPALHLHYGDLADSNSLYRAIEKSQPSEIYNLAAQSHVHVSFDNPEYSFDVDATGPVRLLECIRNANPLIRYYQASSSEMFGKTLEGYAQNERTMFQPQSPYGCAKVAAFWATKNYREAYGMHASNGILFNHESPRRGEQFVTRKITRAIAAIKAGRQKILRLGNLEAKRDWGFAGDYVEAMWRMLRQPASDDFVIATGETHTVREFVCEAFEYAGLDWPEHVEYGHPDLLRPNEVDFLLGDALKANEVLGWRPKTSFKQLVQMMVDADLYGGQTHTQKQI